MKNLYRAMLLLIAVFIMFGCGAKETPKDSNGLSPEQVLMNTYTLILDGKFEAAQKNFSPEFIEEMITKNKSTFVEYCKNTEGWKKEWLKTKLVGNDYNDNIWRVKIIPDEGKGANNRPGIVQDLHIIDGTWKIVFWGHYPKS